MNRAFREHFHRNFFLRHHMAVLLALTVMAGMLIDRLLLWLGMRHLCPRYTISVTLSYLAFLGLVRMWLAYVAVRFRPLEDYPDPQQMAKTKSEGQAKVAGPHWWEWLELVEIFGIGEGCGWLMAVVGGVAVAIFMVAAVLLMFWESPAMLADAAFEFFLAAGLTRSLKRVDRPDWSGSVLTATWKPFFCVLGITILAGLTLEVAFPGAGTLKDVLKLMGR